VASRILPISMFEARNCKKEKSNFVEIEELYPNMLLNIDKGI